MCLIIAHGDGDGVISAAVLKTIYPEAMVTFSKPQHLLRLLEELGDNPEITKIYIADIGLDRHNSRPIVECVQRHKDKIKLWVDHHHGSEKLIPVLKDKLLLDVNQPSCPAVMAINGIKVLPKWLEAANACDRPLDYPDNSISLLWNQAFRVIISLQAPKELRKLQYNFLEFLLHHKHAKYLANFRSRYELIAKNTLATLPTIQDVSQKIGFVKITRQTKIDKRLLFLEAYKKYEILILWEMVNGKHFLTLGTKNQKIDFLKIFSLSSGSPFRVRLKGNVDVLIEIILQQLNPWLDPDER